MHKNKKLRKAFAVILSAVLLFSASIVTAFAAPAQEAGTYRIDAALSCFISAMGGQEFGGVYDSAMLTKTEDGETLLTVHFKTTPMNIYTIQFNEFVDADDPATIGFYDADGVLHTAADENPIVTYTASEDTVAGPTNAQVPFSGERHYLTSMTFPISDNMNEITMWLYINSTVMGLQFCDGSGDASTNQPGVATKYKSTLTFDVCEALGHSFTNYVSNDDVTCTEDGTKTAVCDRCDATDTITDEGSAKGHADADENGFCDECNTDLRDASKVCKYCNQVHEGFFGKIVGFFHAILAFFKSVFAK